MLKLISFFCFQQVMVLHFPFIHSSIYSFMYWILIPPPSSSSEDVYKMSQEGPSCGFFFFFLQVGQMRFTRHLFSFLTSFLLIADSSPLSPPYLFASPCRFESSDAHTSVSSPRSPSPPCRALLLFYFICYSLSSVFSCIWWTWAVEKQQTSNGRSVCM